MNLIKSDQLRKGEMPLYQPLLRKLQTKSQNKRWGGVTRLFSMLYRLVSFFYCNEISYDSKIGPGLYIGHPICITINAQAKIGKNCNIHKGVTIGQENRGKRKGAPTIGDNVWIGINSTIVGRISIGNDVLIAPNTYVNCDVPSHSIVFGNPCIIKSCEFATENYINNTI